MFEELEPKKSREEKKTLVLEAIIAVAICLLIGAALFWFFTVDV